MGLVDFDSATIDPATGGLKPEFVPESMTGGPGDKPTAPAASRSATRSTSIW
jgi:hypothetical protein